MQELYLFREVAPKFPNQLFTMKFLTWFSPYVNAEERKKAIEIFRKQYPKDVIWTMKIVKGYSGITKRPKTK